MNREYDVFERRFDGLLIWRCHVQGLLEAYQQLAQLSNTTANECLAMHLKTKEIVARVNVNQLTPPALGDTSTMEKQPLPVTRCTVCGNVGYEIILVNKRCGKMFGGKLCHGTNRRAARANEWFGCPSCNGTGGNGGKCKQCNGAGWLFVSRAGARTERKSREGKAE